MTWVCDICGGLMEVTHEEENRNKVKCTECGTYWYVDDEDEYINDGSGWNAYEEYDTDDEDESGESLSVYDAALIWASRGKDEDYTFGYTEDELEDAL